MKGKPHPKPADVARVLDALAHGTWIKGREITAIYRIPGRMIRAVAEHTGEIISGQRGYKLTSHATAEELREAHADLVSRARHIQARADLLQRQINQLPTRPRPQPARFEPFREELLL